jgi:hypothetical protein
METESHRAVFAEVHKAIDEAAQAAVDSLSLTGKPSPTYPPGVELTTEELNLLSGIVLTTAEREVLKKIIADACSYPLFHMLSILDGVTAPYVIEIPDWTGGVLGTSEDGPMLHDEFFDTYWDYEERKKS